MVRYTPGGAQELNIEPDGRSVGETLFRCARSVFKAGREPFCLWSLLAVDLWVTKHGGPLPKWAIAPLFQFKRDAFASWRFPGQRGRHAPKKQLETQVKILERSDYIDLLVKVGKVVGMSREKAFNGRLNLRQAYYRHRRRILAWEEAFVMSTLWSLLHLPSEDI